METKEKRTQGDEAAEPVEKGAAAVAAFAAGREGLSDGDERDALDWLLGARPAAEFDVEVKLDTPDGQMPLTFTLRAIDGRKIDAIEQRNVNATTGQLDVITAACEIVAAATVRLSGRAGHEISLKDPRFLTMKVRNRESGEVEDLQLASPAEAIEQRFRTEIGLIQGAAERVRAISGYDTRRVGDPKRRVPPTPVVGDDPLTRAAGN